MRPTIVRSHPAVVAAPPAAKARRAPMSDAWVQRLNTLQVLVVAVLILAPIAWMVMSSFKPPAEVTAYPPRFVFSPTLDNYRQLFQTTPFLHYTWNSVVITVGSTLIGLVLGVPLAFATSWTRITWPATVTLLARMAPGTLFLLPWYVMFRELGLIGSYWALIVTHAVITMPIVVWVLLPFFDNLPRSVLESAQVDGCSVPRILWRIALPMVMPGLVVSSILAFVFSWNYFLFALVLSNGDTKTLIAASFNFIGEGATYWGALMAAATLIALPPLILAFVVQRRLVSGLAIGAVKG
jgi:multiple sugar transport system permease protein